VVKNGEFLRIQVIRIVDEVLADQLRIHDLVVQLPDAGIDLTEKIGGGIIAEEEAAVAVADEILVIAGLNIEIFPDVEIDGGSVVVIIVAVRLERLPIAGPGTALNWTARCWNQVGPLSWLSVI
jgi:hypothetical protein